MMRILDKIWFSRAKCGVNVFCILLFVSSWMVCAILCNGFDNYISHASLSSRERSAFMYVFHSVGYSSVLNTIIY